MNASIAADRQWNESKGRLRPAFPAVAFLAGFLALFYYAGQSYAAGQEEQEGYAALLDEGRFLSQRIGLYAVRTANGQPKAGDVLGEASERFDQVLDALRRDNPEASLPAEFETRLETVRNLWDGRVRKNVGVVLSRHKEVRQMRQDVERIDAAADELAELSDEIATLMARRGAASDQVYIASRQLMLSQRFARSVGRVLDGGDRAARAADRFGRDAALFGRVLEGLRNGNRELGVRKITDPDIRARLTEADAQFSKISETVSSVLQRSPGIFMVTESVEQIVDDSALLLKRIDSLRRANTAHITIH